MKIKSQKDFYSGLTFAVIGAAFAWGAQAYTIGTAARMGPGYFPMLLGTLLAVLGLFMCFKALIVETEDGDKIGKWVWRPVGFIVAANVVFGILIGGLPSIKLPAMGMIIAIYGVVLIAANGGKEFKWKEGLWLATILAVGSWVIFIWLLKLQIQVWPTFITG